MNRPRAAVYKQSLHQAVSGYRQRMKKCRAVHIQHSVNRPTPEENTCIVTSVKRDNNLLS